MNKRPAAVIYAHRYRRPPRKKKAVSLTGLAIVTTTARRGRKSAAWVDDGGEVSPELKAFVARMMRPPD